MVCASKYFRLFGGLAWQRNPGGSEGDHIIVNSDAARATSITCAVQNPPLQVEGPLKRPVKLRTPVMGQIFGLALHLFDASGCLEAHIRRIIFIWQRFFPLQRLTITHFFPGSLTHRKPMPRLPDSFDGIFADLTFDHAFQSRFNVDGGTTPPRDTCHQNNVPLLAQRACSTTPSTLERGSTLHHTETKCGKPLRFRKGGNQPRTVDFSIPV